MDKIPVTFTRGEKEIHGTLEQVTGSGVQMYHLMVNNFFWGTLRHVSGEQWVFNSNKPGMEEYAQHFGNIVQLWYE